MKILLVHNFYGASAPSGENQVVEAERALLLSHNHEVEMFTRNSDEIRNQGKFGLIKGAAATPWNPWTAQSIRKLAKRFQPDIVHVHNTFPLISPSIFYAIGSRSTHVLTLHNYRLFCPAAIPMRNGKACTECLVRQTVWPGLHYGCYRNSRLATIPLALNIALHRWLKTWSKKVDVFITLSDFQRQQMINAGLPAKQIHIKPNYYPGTPNVIPLQQRQPCVLFAGRLTQEKGIRTLVQAWIQWGEQAPELRIAGNGPLREEMEILAASKPSVPIKFLGHLSGEAAQSEIALARLLVLPSECFEGFPMVVREAFAFGTPVAVSDIGPLPSIVKNGINGVVFPPGVVNDLLHTIRKLWDAPVTLEKLAIGARDSYESKYTEDINYRILMNIYEKGMTKKTGR